MVLGPPLRSLGFHAAVGGGRGALYGYSFICETPKTPLVSNALLKKWVESLCFIIQDPVRPSQSICWTDGSRKNS